MIWKVKQPTAGFNEGGKSNIPDLETAADERGFTNLHSR